MGFVAAVGAGVKDLFEGDAVGVGWLHDACGHCEYCERAMRRATQQRIFGERKFAEYAISTLRLRGGKVLLMPAITQSIRTGAVISSGCHRRHGRTSAGNGSMACSGITIIRGRIGAVEPPIVSRIAVIGNAARRMTMKNDALKRSGERRTHAVADAKSSPHLKPGWPRAPMP